MFSKSALPRFVLFTVLLPLALATNHIDIALQKRQNNVPIGTGVTPSPTPATSTSAAASTAADSTNAAAASASPSTVPSVRPDSTQVSASQPSDNVAPSQVSPQSDSQSQTTSSPTTEAPAAKSSTDSKTSLEILSTRSDHSIVVASKSVISKTQQVVSTIVTVSGSSTFSHTLTTGALVAVSTSTSTSTAAPGLAGTDSDSNDSGPTPSQKRIIIGVVVGIGGALLLGGLAVVAWRIWGRKRNVGDEDNDLMGSHPGSSGHEKTSSVNGNTPFKSTLDQYHSPHSPPGPVNTASNF